MERITLRQLIEMFERLPDEIKDKKLGYLDLSHMGEEELKELEERMRASDSDWIEFCG